MNTCKDIYQAHRLDLDNLHTEFQLRINAAAEKEFPRGTKVTWRIPGHRGVTLGHVTGHVEGETASIMVSSEGGSGFIMRAWELEKLEDSTP